MRLIRALMLVAALGMLLPLAPAPAPAEAASCEFILGFKVIHDLIPNEVGDCVTNEFHGSNGDGLQITTAWHKKGGLLAWRKADNWTAYTDGGNTWVNGPNGLQKRGNMERFCPWEANPDNLPCVGNPLPPVKTTPTVATPTPKPQVDTPVPPVPMRWHEDAEKKFQYPAGWPPAACEDKTCYGYYEPNGRALIVYYAPDRMGAGYKLSDMIVAWQHRNANKKGLSFGAAESVTINGFPALIQGYEYTADDGFRERGLIFVIQNGALVYEVDYYGIASRWSTLEPIFRWSINSFIPKSAG